MGELLRIRELTTGRFHGSALHEFRLQIFEQELLGLVGLNGSGKSTLAGIFAGEIPVKQGVLFFDGNRYDWTVQKISRTFFERVGFYVVRNETRLIGNLNIAENMSISFKPHLRDIWKNPGKQEKVVTAVLHEFTPSLNPYEKGGTLSLAVHWELGILKAYMNGAKLIILDRIFEFCSKSEQDELFTLIHRLNQKGTSFLITYNKVAPILETCDRVAVVRDGTLSAIIHKNDYDPKLVALHLLIGQDYIGREAVRKVDDKTGEKPLMEIRNLCAGVELQNFSFTLYKEEILGISDPVQEKTTALLRVLNGSKTPEKGEIYVHGKPLVFGSEHHALRYGIGIVSEKFFDNLFFRDLSTGDNLILSVAKRASRFLGYIPSLVEQYFRRRYPAEIGIPGQLAERPVKFLEQDLQFILALHMRILSGAKVFLLENPVRSADLLTRNMVYQKIDSLRKKKMGVIFISADYSELDGFCDRIIQCDSQGMIGGDKTP
ncbi:ATP-binding cassette domain-containing protein [Sediminispirochaeta bajacaliforniensis]|uniref:ATP-binding cassette domain-containing protein n=1 Tax=Sediminispirochaeta bajacaliforniensis TaxID=148 RepID=UPI000368CBC6|nr:ATP-binding cassette domain-containing protein [Sediminispirochaeta bajacaliforniensis]